MTKRIMRLGDLLVTGLLLLIPGVYSNTFYPIDYPGLQYYCPGDHVAFQVNLSNPLPLFGTEVKSLFMSNLGFLSDVYDDNTVVPAKFPLSESSTHTLACAGVRCWLDYYYSDVEVQEIQAQNYTEDCVHGQSLTEVFDFMTDFSYLPPISEPGRILSPENCLPSNVDPPASQIFNWMISSYWQNLEVRYQESIMSSLETTEATILDQVQQDVQSLASVSSFVPTLAVIFTWSGISFYDGFYYGYPEADFQIVLATDGSDTFAIYNYETLTFGGAQGGFDAADNTTYCSFVFSRSERSTAWTELTNIGVEGRIVLKMGPGFDSSVCEPLRDGVPSCVCEEGWEGTICASSIDDCINHNCSAEAVCVDGHLGYTCDFCSGVNCENDGVCVSNETTQSYHCECVGSYIGVHCEQCVDLSCQNGGVCTNNVTSGQSNCTCAQGYSGSTCEVDNICEDGACENDGVCVSNQTTQSYQCECVGSYTGVHCEQCVDLSCQNGGVCTHNASSGQSTCTCAQGYSGNACQISLADQQVASEESQSESGFTDWEIVAMALGSAAGVGAIGTAIYLGARRGKNKQEEEKVLPEGRNEAWTAHA